MGRVLQVGGQPVTTRVLWFTNLPIGEAPSLLGVSRSVFGGWLEGLFTEVASAERIELSVAFPVKMATEAACFATQRASYYPFQPGPSGEEPKLATRDRLRAILDDARPDLVHVFGTELQHSLTVIQLCRQLEVPMVVQMQGLMGSIADHYFGWLPERVTKRTTPTEALRRRTLRQLRDKFAATGKRERLALQLTHNVIGRTTYDHAWVNQVNPQAQYCPAEESLRDSFYHGQWCVPDCERYSLLVSQATVPYKGAHIAISALPIILRRFPETRLYIAGPNPIGGPRPHELLKRSSYGWYLRRLIVGLGLTDHVQFLGALNEQAMRDRYLKTHAFVSCSSVENSSNSVSEAKILGLPVVASYVGGIPDLVEHGETGFLYQGDAPYMLAHYVMEVFADDARATQIGEAARSDALRRHDRARNARRIFEIYEAVLRGARGEDTQ